MIETELEVGSGMRHKHTSSKNLFLASDLPCTCSKISSARMLAEEETVSRLSR